MKLYKQYNKQQITGWNGHQIIKHVKLCGQHWWLLIKLAKTSRFKSTGQIKISELNFFPKVEAQDVVDGRAETLALQMD